MFLCVVLAASACGDDGEDGGDVSDDGGDTPETACCDPDERPGEGGTFPCIEGASCCADGSWRCNEGDGSPTCDSAGGVCNGGACDDGLTPAETDGECRAASER